MKHRDLLSRRVRQILLSGAVAAFALPAFSEPQTTPPAATQADQLEEVVITGSRIQSPNLKSTSPIEVISRQELEVSGTNDISTLINRLPQNLQSNVGDISNTSNPLSGGAFGVTTVDLRGLGPQRTLVLIDGRRLGVGDANTGNNNPAPDLDQIPALLVKRVDVVTGGASSVYGSDAVAGVVNFVMRHDFVGAEIDAQYGFDNHSNGNSYLQGLEAAKGFPAPSGSVTDGYNRNASILLGTNFADGKGNIEVYGSFLRQNPVSMGSRDFAACLTASTATGLVCSGSSSSNKFTPTSGPAAGNPYAVVNGQFVPYPAAGQNPPPLFNSSPYQYLSRADDRYSAGFLGHYEVNPHADVYMDFMYMNDRTNSQVAPGGLFQAQYNINCNNPLLSAQEASTICSPASIASGANVSVLVGRRNVEGGGRYFDAEHSNYRGVLGSRGEIDDGWKYDVYASYYYTSLYQSNDHYFSLNRITNAFQVTSVGGTPTCISGPPCVPYNPFVGAGVVSNVTQGITQGALNYLNAYGTAYGTVDEKVISGNISGDLSRYGVKLPTASEGVALDVGVEHRGDDLNYVPDQALGSGDLIGSSGASPTIRNAHIAVDEFFGEIRVPLVQEKPFVDDLVFDGGARHSNYTTAGGVNTYKLGLQWAPLKDVRIRGSYNRAIRAPSLVELYNPKILTQTSVVSTDPCAGANPTASLTQCERTGVTAAQYGHIIDCPAGQCSTVLGGNSALTPETSDTYSFGFTLTPTMLPNFSASLDFYRIVVKNEVDNIPQSTTLQNCLNSGNPVFCSQIVRNNIGAIWSGSPSIANGGYIGGTLVNIGQAGSKGLDFQVAYSYPVDRWGKLTFVDNGTYLISAPFQSTPASPVYDCAGLFGATCQTVNPSVQNNFRVTWETPVNLLLSMQWRYISGSSLDTNTTQPGLTNGKFNVFNASMPAVSYLDLTAIYSVKDFLTFRAGVLNVLDKDPPVVSASITGTGTPNAYPTYDLLGRQVFIGATAKF